MAEQFTPGKAPQLLDQIWQKLRLLHDSIL